MAVMKSTLSIIGALMLCQAVSAGRQLAQAPSTPSDPLVTQLANAATAVLPTFATNPIPAIPEVASQVSNVVANVGAATTLGVAQIQENLGSGLSNMQAALPGAVATFPAAINILPGTVQSAVTSAIPAIPGLTPVFEQPAAASPST